jgi:hypothetical protein
MFALLELKKETKYSFLRQSVPLKMNHYNYASNVFQNVSFYHPFVTLLLNSKTSTFKLNISSFNATMDLLLHLSEINLKSDFNVIS